MSSLNSVSGHGVRDSVEGQVHVLLEESAEFGSNEELLGSSILKDFLPDHLLFAVSRLKLVLGDVKVDEMVKIGTIIRLDVITRGMELFNSGSSCNKESSGECGVHYLE